MAALEPSGIRLRAVNSITARLRQASLTVAAAPSGKSPRSGDAGDFGGQASRAAPATSPPGAIIASVHQPTRAAACTENRGERSSAGDIDGVPESS